MTKGGNLPNPSVAKGINLQPPDLIFTADINIPVKFYMYRRSHVIRKKSLAPNTRAQILLPNTQDPESTSFLLILIT